MPSKPAPLPNAETQLLIELGQRLRGARLRRRMTASEVAAGAGMTRVTLHRVEGGEPAVTVGTLIKVMGVLGLAADFALLGRDDKMGRMIQDGLLPRPRIPAREPHEEMRARAQGPQGATQRIRIERFPQLKQITWHLGPNIEELAPEEAFALYERNWRHVDRAAMQPHELALLEELTATVGKGVLLV